METKIEKAIPVDKKDWEKPELTVLTTESTEGKSGPGVPNEVFYSGS